MDIRPTDRRGLGETVAWAASLNVVGVLLVVDLVKTGHLDSTLLGLLSGVVAAVLARGTQSAAERSAREEQSRALEDAARGWAKKAEESARKTELLLEEKQRERKERE
jgi:hypothetical protein